MKCESQDCTREATSLVGFPWSDDVPACAEHVAAAKQLLTNLNRADELRLSPLEQLEPVAAQPQVLNTTGETSGVDTPRDAQPAGVPDVSAQEHAIALRTMTLKALELELELERARHARVTSELELMARIKERIEGARTLFDHMLAALATLLQDTVPSLMRAGLERAQTELEPSTVDGNSATAKPPDVSSSPPAQG